VVSLVSLNRFSEKEHVKEHVFNEYLVSFIFQSYEPEINLTYSLDQENITYDVRTLKYYDIHSANITSHTLIEGKHEIKITIEDTNNPTVIQFNLIRNNSCLKVIITREYEIISQYYDYFAFGD
jgi:hypothetical protein